MTLIEVLGSLALMGTILVALLTVRTKVMRQQRASEERLRAVAVADAVLLRHAGENDAGPLIRIGESGEEGGFRWLVVAADGGLSRTDGLDVAICRLNVFSVSTGRGSADRSTNSAGRTESLPIVSVDLVVPPSKPNPAAQGPR